MRTYIEAISDKYLKSLTTGIAEEEQVLKKAITIAIYYLCQSDQHQHLYSNVYPLICAISEHSKNHFLTIFSEFI